MTDDFFDFVIGLRCRLSELGRARSPRTKVTTGTIVGTGSSRSSVRILFDGAATPVQLHKKYIEAILDEPGRSRPATKRPRDVAERTRTSRAERKMKRVGFLRETFTLPLHAARLQARQFLDARPAAENTIIERWRQLADGQIEFTMRRQRPAD